MRRTDLTKHSRNSVWRIRAVWLALAGTGLMTAIAAAEIGGRPGMNVDAAMRSAIVRQRIAAGEVAVPPPAPTVAATGAPQTEAETRAAILAEAAATEAQMNTALLAGEKLKLQAYQAKDIIRMNFIAAKLDEMKTVMAITEQALAIIREPGQDLFVMRAKLSTIRQGADQLKQAMAAVEAANGDTTDPTSSFGNVNAEHDPSEGATDPSAAPTPNTDTFDRPAPASPYL